MEIHFAFCERRDLPRWLSGRKQIQLILMIDIHGADKAAAIPIPPPIQREARQFFERP
jgi:hypothetical protein